MTDNGAQQQHETLIRDAVNGDKAALAELFEGYRQRLRKMIDLRLDHRIQGRVNPSDVLQEAFIDLASKLPTYADDPKLPFFVWVRRLTGLRLANVHRHHLGTAKRDAAREVSLYRGRMPQATSMALASKLIGNSTSASGRVVRAERLLKLQEILNAMDEGDREILAMRHFEHLSNSEVAAILEVTEATAGMRHMRALRRLQAQLRQHSTLFADDFGLRPEARQQTNAGED